MNITHVAEIFYSNNFLLEQLKESKKKINLFGQSCCCCCGSARDL